MISSNAFAAPGVSRAAVARKTCVVALRVAPWVVFCPITGFMCERALRSYRQGHPILAGLYVTLNVMTLIAIPILTAYIGVRIQG